MAVPSPILNALNEFLAGCGAESQKMELFGLLRDIADSLAREEIEEGEAEKYVRDLAGTVAALRQRAGLESDIEAIAARLLDAVKAEATERQVAAMRESLRRARLARRERRSGGGIL